MQAKDEYNATTEGNFTITLTDFIDTQKNWLHDPNMRFYRESCQLGGLIEDSAPTNKKLLAITITDEAEGASVRGP